MKSPALRLFLLGALLATTTSAQPVSLGDALKAAVLRTDEARVYTILGRQTDALADLMTDDCLYVHSNGWIQTKAQFVAALAAGELNYDGFLYELPPAVRLFGAETGIVTGTARVDVRSKAGEKRTLRLVVTSTYVVQGSQWKLASYHSCLAQPPAK
jgi:ketosteroid isomerase-like protein